MIALLALALPIVLLASILSSHADRAPAAPSLAPQLARLQASGARVATELASWHRGHSARKPLAAVRAAIADERAVARWVRAQRRSGQLPEDLRLDNALGADYDYLDALGSSLPNPRSLLRFELAARAQRARAALAAVPGGADVAATVRGWQRVASRTAT
jgi:hypothetical protein